MQTRPGGAVAVGMQWSGMCGGPSTPQAACFVLGPQTPGGGDSAGPRTPTTPPPPPPKGASGRQLVVKGMSPRSQRAPKAPNGVM